MASKLFLCHATEDKARVRDLYQKLKKDGYDPWLDEEDLLPGQDWEVVIARTVSRSIGILVCLSNSSVTKRGYVQKEIKLALDAADQLPEDTIFIIPVRLEECRVPQRLSRWQWVDLYSDRGYERLKAALRSPNLNASVTSSYGKRAHARILVVGDWWVEEAWLVHRSSSPTSSYTGQGTHFLAAAARDSHIVKLAGAGLTASILNSFRPSSKSHFDVVGIGIWHQGDTEILQSMVNSSIQKYSTPYKIGMPAHVNELGSRLYNLGKVFANTANYEYGTDRRIFMFNRAPQGVSLISRLDWQLQYSEAPIIWLERESALDNSELRGLIHNEEDPIDAVIINDTQQRVISDSLIRWLLRITPDASWFVLSSKWRPVWLPLLYEANVQLIFLQSPSIQNMKEAAWVTSSGQISLEGIEAFDKMRADLQTSKLLNIVAQVDRTRMLARLSPNQLNERENDIGLSIEDEAPIELGAENSTQFMFAATTAFLLDGINVEKALRHAQCSKKAWIKNYIVGLRNPSAGSNTDSWPTDVDYVNDAATVKYIQSYSWKTAKIEWIQASRHMGVIDIGDRKRLELWRGMIELPGFVCVVMSKRKQLREMLELIRKTEKGHTSILLVGAHGVGKKSLARCLAMNLSMSLIEFSPEQAMGTSEILDFFDCIADYQIRTPDKKVAVLVNGIDKKIDSENIYDMFLSPIQDGIYMRRGHAFALKPCLWLFTSQKYSQGHITTPKKEEFHARVMAPMVDMGFTNFDEEEQAERVYIGALLLKKTIPEMRRVSEKILWAFQNMSPSAARTKLERFACSLQCVKNEILEDKSVPLSSLKILGIKESIWASLPSGPFIEIWD